MRPTAKKRALIVLAAIFTITLLFAAILPTKGHTAGTAAIEQADTAMVCMVNDNVMAKELIAVEVDGKTYYGCCQGCVGKLKGKREFRYGTDPLSGSEVDKATAFIVRGAGGIALYFENRENAEKYLAKEARL